MKFQKINNITGWAVFGVALITYWLTMEETASYWDCGEFIAVSYKLEVPHPPGAPLFLIIGRIFSFPGFWGRNESCLLDKFHQRVSQLVRGVISFLVDRVVWKEGDES